MATLTNSQTEVQTRIDALNGSSTLTEVIEGGIAAKKAEAAGLTIDRTNLDIQITAQDTAVGSGTDIGELIAFLAANGRAGVVTPIRTVYGNPEAITPVEPDLNTIAPQGGYYRVGTPFTDTTMTTLFTTTDTIIITKLRLAVAIPENRVVAYYAVVGGVLVGSLLLNPPTGGANRTLNDVQQLIPMGVPLDGLTIIAHPDGDPTSTSGTYYMDFIGGKY